MKIKWQKWMGKICNTKYNGCIYMMCFEWLSIYMQKHNKENLAWWIKWIILSIQRTLTFSIVYLLAINNNIFKWICVTFYWLFNFTAHMCDPEIILKIILPRKHWLVWSCQIKLNFASQVDFRVMKKSIFIYLFNAIFTLYNLHL